MDQSYRGDRPTGGRDSYDMNYQRGHGDNRGYSDEREPWRQPPRRDLYYTRDRSASPARKPAPWRRNTAQDPRPTPQSPAVMPSPITSPSETGVEVETEKKLEKATDPRRRAKLASGSQSPLATPKSLVSQAQPNSSLANTGVRVAQTQDVQMTDDNLNPSCSKPVQSLIKLSESITRAGAHFGVFQRHEEQYAEKRKAKDIAVERFNDNPKYVEHFIRQESTAAAEFKKSSKLKAELDSDVNLRAKNLMSELSATFQHSLSDSVVSGDEIKDLQGQLDSLKILMQQSKTSDISDKIESLRKALEERIFKVENDGRSLKGSVIAQHKAGLTEALNQLEGKTTPLLAECRNAKEHCQKLQKGVSDTMDGFKADKAVIHSQLRILKEENAALRARITTLEAQNTSRQQDMVDLKAASVTRNDFEKFKAEMQLKLQQAPVHFPKAALEEPRDTDKLLEPYVSGYKKDLAMISTLVQSSSDASGAAKATAEFAHTRLDGFHRDFGALRDRLDKVEKQRPVETPPSPVPSPAISQAAFNSLRLEHDTVVKRAVSSEKAIEGVQHTLRVLNSRYNNLSSEGLAQQIAGIVTPINAQVFSDVTNLKMTMGRVNGQIRDLYGADTRFNQRLDSVEAKVASNAQLSDNLGKLEAHINVVAANTASHSIKLQDRFTKHQGETTTQINDLKAADSLRKEELEKISKDLAEQGERHQKTCLKIDEHLNDEVHTLKEKVKGLEENQKVVDTLAQTDKVNASKLATLQVAVSTLETHREQTKAEEASDDAGLRADFESLKEGLSKEKASIDKRINSVISSVEDLKGLAGKEALPDLLGRLSPLEDAVQSLKDLVNKHTDQLDALGTDALDTFKANTVNGQSSNTTLEPPFQIRGSAGQSSANDSSNDAKVDPRIPTGPRNIATPTRDLFPGHLASNSKSSATPSNKRRTRSPVSGSTKKKAKRAKDRMDFEEKRRSAVEIDLTGDGTEDDDDLDRGPAMMGGHNVVRRKGAR